MVMGGDPGSCKVHWDPYLHAPCDLAQAASSQCEFCNKKWQAPSPVGEQIGASTQDQAWWNTREQPWLLYHCISLILCFIFLYILMRDFSVPSPFIWKTKLMIIAWQPSLNNLIKIMEIHKKCITKIHFFQYAMNQTNFFLKITKTVMPYHKC